MIAVRLLAIGMAAEVCPLIATVFPGDPAALLHIVKEAKFLAFDRGQHADEVLGHVDPVFTTFVAA